MVTFPKSGYHRSVDAVDFSERNTTTSPFPATEPTVSLTLSISSNQRVPRGMRVGRAASASALHQRDASGGQPPRSQIPFKLI